MKKLFAYIFIFFIFSCGQDNDTGKYLYLDIFYCIHTSPNCKELEPCEVNGKVVSLSGVGRISVNEFCGSTKYCKTCVSDETYEKLVKISEENKYFKAQKKRKELYDSLIEAGYNVGKDYAEFDSIINIKESACKWVFKTAKKEGWDVGADYEAFKFIINAK